MSATPTPITKVSELKSKAIGSTIQAIQGTITSIGKYFSGLGKNNSPYSYQDFTIEDGGESFPGTFSEREEVKDIVGRRVSLLAHHGDNGITGVKIKERPDRDKKLRAVLWITRTGALTILGANPVPQQKPPYQPPNNHTANPNPPQSQTQKPPVNQPAPQNGNGEANWKAVGTKMMQLADLITMATSAVVNVVVPAVEKRTGYKMPPEHIQAASASLFIEYSKKYGGSIPAGRLPEPKKPVVPGNSPAPVEHEPSDSDGDNVQY